jgi:hypothetical protein
MKSDRFRINIDFENDATANFKIWGLNLIHIQIIVAYIQGILKGEVSMYH